MLPGVLIYTVPAPACTILPVIVCVTSGYANEPILALPKMLREVPNILPDVINNPVVETMFACNTGVKIFPEAFTIPDTVIPVDVMFAIGLLAAQRL